VSAESRENKPHFKETEIGETFEADGSVFKRTTLLSREYRRHRGESTSSGGDATDYGTTSALLRVLFPYIQCFQCRGISALVFCKQPAADGQGVKATKSST
jgi:hypothetical protein